MGHYLTFIFVKLAEISKKRNKSTAKNRQTNNYIINAFLKKMKKRNKKIESSLFNSSSSSSSSADSSIDEEEYDEEEYDEKTLDALDMIQLSYDNFYNVLEAGLREKSGDDIGNLSKAEKKIFGAAKISM